VTLQNYSCLLAFSDSQCAVLLQVLRLYVGVGPTYLIVKKVIGFVFHAIIKNLGPSTILYEFQEWEK
jgi:hypothetical protein